MFRVDVGVEAILGACEVDSWGGTEGAFEDASFLIKYGRHFAYFCGCMMFG